MSEHTDWPNDGAEFGDDSTVAGAEMTRARLLRLAAGAVASGTVLGALAPEALARETRRAAGIAQAIKRGGVVLYADDRLVPADTLDPNAPNSDGVGMLHGMIYEGLSTYDPNQVPLPNLVSWKTNAKLTKYTLTVRRGVTFHDGRPFTADDVAWNIRRFLNPANKSSVYARLAVSLAPSGVKVLDPQTLTLTLKQPDSGIMGPFARVVAFIVPAGTTDFKAGIGTGPFKLKSFTPGRSFEVVANNDYWQPGIPYLDGVRVVLIVEASTKVQGVLAGDTQITELDYQSVPLVRSAKNVKITEQKNTVLLNAAMDQTQPPFNDARVREALKRSIDREKIVRIAYAGFGTVTADVPAPMSDPQFPSALRSRTKQNLPLARKLMTEAGYPNGLDLTLNTIADEIHSSWSLAFAASVEGSPFRINVKQIPISLFFDKIWLHAPFYGDDWNRRAPLEAMAQMFASKAVWNEPKMHSPQLDKLISQGFATQGRAQAKVVAKALELISTTSGDIIPAYRHRLFLSKSNVQGITPSTSYTLDFRRTWLS